MSKASKIKKGKTVILVDWKNVEGTDVYLFPQDLDAFASFLEYNASDGDEFSLKVQRLKEDLKLSEN